MGKNNLPLLLGAMTLSRMAGEAHDASAEGAEKIKTKVSEV